MSDFRGKFILLVCLKYVIDTLFSIFIIGLPIATNRGMANVKLHTYFSNPKLLGLRICSRHITFAFLWLASPGHGLPPFLEYFLFWPTEAGSSPFLRFLLHAQVYVHTYLTPHPMLFQILPRDRGCTYLLTSRHCKGAASARGLEATH
jgi:hypothetical protein